MEGEPREVKAAVALAFFVALAACAAPVAHQTASGRAEATYPGVKVENVKAALVNRMTNGGYRVVRDSQFQLAFEKPNDNLAVNLLLGSKYDPQTNLRVTFDIAQAGDAVRVVSDLAVITNPGSGFEQRTDLNGSAASAEIQDTLDGLKYQIKS